MTDTTDRDLLGAAIVRAAETLIARGVLSKSLHGNISVRLPGTDTILMTGSSLVGLTTDALAVIDLDDRVVEGEVSATEMEIVAMHTAFYRERSEAGSVMHTHSPYATAFAVASTPMPCVAESMARWGILGPTPVATWAPRGSSESVSNILRDLQRVPESPAVLLENHGILVSGADTNEAVRRSIAIEENAQLAVLARSLGGARQLDAGQAAAAVQRRTDFAADGSSGA